MAKIVNRNQQVIRRGVSPRPHYTRVVGFYLYVPFDAAFHYATTPVLGNNIWLLRVTIRHVPRVVNAANRTIYEVVTGKTRILSINDLASWTIVIPNITDGGQAITMQMGDGENEHTEEMKKYYAGENRMFGIAALRIGADPDALQVTFEISEG